MSYFASSTFAKIKPTQNTSDYISNKKSKYMFCSPNICHPNKNIGTSSHFLQLKKANQLAYYPCSQFDKTKLYVNLYSKLLLNSDIPVITDISGNISPTEIDPNTAPYLRYIIDTNGDLFGNTPCGYNNYVNYMVYDTSANPIV